MQQNQLEEAQPAKGEESEQEEEEDAPPAVMLHHHHLLPNKRLMGHQKASSCS